MEKSLKNIVIFSAFSTRAGLLAKKKNIFTAFKEVVNILYEKKVKVFLLEETAKLFNPPKYNLLTNENIEKQDLIVSLGGDGTLLRAARLVFPYKIPVLGINLGGLGFLTDVTGSKIKEALNKLFENKYKIEKRMLQEVSVRHNGKVELKTLSLNDVVAFRGSYKHLLNLKTCINGRYACTFISDGLIISTPTGSTAYSLSAGGPIISPEVEVIVINAICPHTLSARPIIISAKDFIEVSENAALQVDVVVDGQVNFPLKKGEILFVKRHPSYARFVRIDKDFYQIVREKLKWVDK